ncbi:MAG: DUF547 domain-containing protein [Planctomycetota bacterium]
MLGRWTRTLTWSAIVLAGLASAWFALAACTTLVAPREPSLAQAPAAATEAFPYDALDALLRQHVDARGNVDYAALRANPDPLEHIYAHLAAVAPDSHPERFPDEASRLAYWLNAYNATVLLSVTRLYPIDSVRDVGVPWYLFFLPDTAGFFYVRKHVFGGNAHSLYDVENNIVRQRFGEPRIHFALNCASAGCPRLPREAFRPATLDAQLERETRRFFGEPRNLAIDDERRTVRLSQILEWYRDDFESPLLDYTATYAPPPTRDALRGRASGYAIEFAPYDWRLNDRGLQR